MKKILIAILVASCAGGAFAGVTFDFLGTDAGSLGSALDNQAGSISYTNSGIVATFTASDGTMNRTGSGDGDFGLNATGTDDTDAFDKGEWINITFDQTITLTNVNVSSWSTSNGDEATIFVDGVSSGIISSTGDHAFNITVTVGDILRIEGTDGALPSAENGWSLDSMTVVPEPATMAMFGIGGVIAFLIRRSACK